jgi:uncharacterized membrane protein
MTKSRKKRKTSAIIPKQDNLSQNKTVTLPQLTPEQVYLAQHHSGPLPTPGDLEYYDNICPGAADRIITMAEKEQDRRIREQEHIAKYNETGLNESVGITRRGQIFAFIIAIITLAAIIYLGFLKMTVVATTLALALGAGVVKTFVTGRDGQAETKQNGNSEETTQNKEIAKNQKAGD